MRLIDKDALMRKLGIAYSCSFCEGNMDGIKCARYTEFVSACKAICEAPEIEPERKPGRLTDEDIQTIRIHMNAYKERLCNWRRWKEAEEYQQIVDKLDELMEVEHE